MRGRAAGAAVIALTLLVMEGASAQSWQVRREVSEGAREVAREKREAAEELRRCTTQECARREIREGYHEVNREKREARHEIRRELREDHRRDQYWRNDGRYYRDGRYWNPQEYERRYYGGRHSNDRSDLIKGIAIGAAVVGVTSAVVNAKDD